MRRTKEEALETRKAILRMALDCFSKRGYALTTFTDIAKRLKLSKGAIFWHFKSKEDLLAELILQECKIYEPLAGIDSAMSLEGIKQAFLAWAEAMQSHQELRQFMTFAISRIEWSEALKKSLASAMKSQIVRDPRVRLQERIAFLRAQGTVDSPLSDAQIAGLLHSVFMGVHRDVWLDQMPIDILSTLDAGLTAILKFIERK